MTAYTLVPQIGRGQNQNVNSKTLKWTVDFSKQTLANTDLLTIGTIPKNFVLERRDVILLTAQGAAVTCELGVTGTLSGLITAGSLNGTLNTAISTTQSLGAGTWFTANTDVVLTANGAISAAKIVIVLRGYILNV